MQQEIKTPTGISLFDRILGALDGLPDVVNTKATTIRALEPLIGAAQTFIVQTFRQAEHGDTVFIEYVGAEGSLRLVIPPKVTETIARQREAVTTAARRRGARKALETKREAGIDPAAALRRRREQMEAGKRPARRKA